MTLPIQADAIRVALLKKYGGIWMDADTIILNGEIFKILNNFELVMFGEEKTKVQNIGFIFASKNSFVINEWLKGIINNVKEFRSIMKNTQTNKTFINQRRKFISWNFLGNGIVDVIVKNISGKRFCRLDRNKLNIFPEITFFRNSSLNFFQRYNHFYFQNRDPQIILNVSKSLILLHNSWTPLKYKLMSEKDFLKQEILLSRLLSEILNNNK